MSKRRLESGQPLQGDAPQTPDESGSVSAIESPSKRAKLSPLFNPQSNPAEHRGNHNVERRPVPGAEYRIYPLSKIDELLQQVKEKHGEKKVRFFLTPAFEFRFAPEGVPTKTVPPHFNMAGDQVTSSGAVCISAGTIKFKDGAISLINHKSSDHEPTWDSLQWALAVAIANEIKFSEDFTIDRLSSSGRFEESYKPTLDSLTKELAPLLSRSEEFIANNQHQEVYKFRSPVPERKEQSSSSISGFDPNYSVKKSRPVGMMSTTAKVKVRRGGLNFDEVEEKVSVKITSPTRPTYKSGFNPSTSPSFKLGFAYAERMEEELQAPSKQESVAKAEPQRPTYNPDFSPSKSESSFKLKFAYASKMQEELPTLNFGPLDLDDEFGNSDEEEFGFKGLS